MRAMMSVCVPVAGGLKTQEGCIKPSSHTVKECVECASHKVAQSTELYDFICAGHWRRCSMLMMVA